MHEQPGPGGLLQAAVDFARPGRFDHDGTGGSGGFRDNDHDAPFGSIQPVDNSAAGLERFCNPATSSG